MSAITPSSNLKIIKLPIELDNNNQLTFNNVEQQTSYFLSKQSLEESDFTYQRKDSIIRYPAHIDSIIEYNYCMYQNENYTNKWFYAYIINMRYINDYMTEIEIATDVFQTWQFDIEYKQTFVEREHVSDDSIGANLVSENLETGEYTCMNVDNFGIGSCHAIVALTEDIFKPTGSYPYQVINSVPTGLHYYLVGDFTSVNFIGFITSYAETNSKPDLINAIFIAPDTLTGYDETDHDFWDYAINEGGLGYAPYHKLPERQNGAINMGNFSISKNLTSIDGYVPRNNKLYTYPYIFLNVDNNAGTSFSYKYEDFSTSNCVFNVLGAISFGCSIRAIPQNYKNISSNNSEGINAPKLPIGSWSTDVYTNWLTQNGVNNAVSIASGVATIGLATAGIIATGGAGAIAGVGAIAGGITQIANTLSANYQHSLIPRQVEGNTNSGDVTYASNNSTFSGYKTCIKSQMARIIDKYFDMYGYKVNIVKIPNIKTRPNWNYVKLINANIHGYIPQIDLNTIKELFNNGITLWHNPSTFLDYSQNNQIT